MKTIFDGLIDNQNENWKVAALLSWLSLRSISTTWTLFLFAFRTWMSRQISWMGRPKAVHQTVLRILLTHPVGDLMHPSCNRHHINTVTVDSKMFCLCPLRYTRRFTESQNCVRHCTAEAVHTLQCAQPLRTHGSKGICKVNTFNTLTHRCKTNMKC